MLFAISAIAMLIGNVFALASLPFIAARRPARQSSRTTLGRLLFGIGAGLLILGLMGQLAGDYAPALAWVALLLGIIGLLTAGVIHYAAQPQGSRMILQKNASSLTWQTAGLSTTIIVLAVVRLLVT